MLVLLLVLPSIENRALRLGGWVESDGLSGNNAYIHGSGRYYSSTRQWPQQAPTAIAVAILPNRDIGADVPEFRNSRL
ncbi:MAG: hypothetical protein ACUVXJ_18045 [Phycisphaerae bacterium]